MPPPPIADEIRRLVRESGLPISEIAAKAQVPPQPLRRFLRGATPSYNVVSAELVFYELTGRGFTEAARLPGRRKGGAK